MSERKTRIDEEKIKRIRGEEATELSEGEEKETKKILGEFIWITQSDFYDVEKETIERLRKLGVSKRGKNE